MVATRELAHADELLDQVAVLAGRPREITELPGGLTNLNLKVATPERTYVARLSRSDTVLLGIDRDAEHANSLIAAAAGVGAPVVDYRPDLGVLLIEFLDGVSLADADVARPGMVARMGAAIRRLHDGGRFVNEFDMFTRQPRYRKLIAERGYRLPDVYDRYAEAFWRLKAALAPLAAPTVACNNDLLAANFVDSGERMWLIDYEYSGNNDAAFELGNTCAECGLGDEQVHALVTAYLGHSDPTFEARVRVQSVVSSYGWALWGFLQAGSSPLDFDFYGWGMDHVDRAVAAFTDPGFDALLDQVARRG